MPTTGYDFPIARPFLKAMEVRMDFGNIFLPLAIGVASLFAVTLLTVTVITHEPQERRRRPPR
jgi:hypothetical protein